MSYKMCDTCCDITWLINDLALPLHVFDLVAFVSDGLASDLYIWTGPEDLLGSAAEAALAARAEAPVVAARVRPLEREYIYVNT